MASAWSWRATATSRRPGPACSARTGRAAVLDAAADGFVRGEGYGAVLLKPLTSALADRDHVYASSAVPSRAIPALPGSQRRRGGRAARTRRCLAECIRHRSGDHRLHGTARVPPRRRRCRGTRGPRRRVPCRPAGGRRAAASRHRLPETARRRHEAASGLAQLVKTVAVLRAHRCRPCQGCGSRPRRRRPRGPASILSRVRRTGRPRTRRAAPSSAASASAARRSRCSSRSGRLCRNPPAPRPGTAPICFSAATPELLASSAARVAESTRGGRSGGRGHRLHPAGRP